MRDHALIYTHPISYSDDTIYSGASTDGSGSSRDTTATETVQQPYSHDEVPFKNVRRQKLPMATTHQEPPFILHHPYGRPQLAFGQEADSLGDPNQVAHDNAPSPPSRSAATPKAPGRHGRSVSLLNRLRHTGGTGSMESPSASPTSSEGSSRDTRSDHTLSHSASSATIRAQALNRPSVRVLPPPQETPPAENERPGAKEEKGRAIKRRSESRSGGGFISQLLRGPSRHSSQPISASNQKQQQNSHQQLGAGSTASGHNAMSHDAANMSPDTSNERTANLLARTPKQQHYAQSPSSVYGGFANISSSNINMNSSAAGHYYSGESDGSVDGRRHSPSSVNHDVANNRQQGQDGGSVYASGQWFGNNNNNNSSSSDSDSVNCNSGPGSNQQHNMASRLVSALPVYEPIDMSRISDSAALPSGVEYPRATRPILPDARMLAPMASLAEVFGITGTNEYNSLSNRELRFAVENHMLVEQHRYLIRDLGHARSAITALKQVVQAKEERLEHYDVVNTELQQRVAVLESVLTPEQRQRLMGMPYGLTLFRMSAAASSGQAPGPPLMQNVDRGQFSQQQQQQQDDVDDDDRVLDPSGSATVNTPLGTQGNANALAEEPDPRRVNRPLSGFVTGYSFNEKPLQHLPRVFSGDYSSKNMQAMGNSVEELAKVITAMPRDEHSVEEIIASKMTDEEMDMFGQQSSGAISSSEHGNDTTNASAVHALDGRPWKQRKSGWPVSGVEPKRRSRFFSALRLSGSTSSAAPVDERSDEISSRQSRRSVSLGNKSDVLASIYDPTQRVNGAAVHANLGFKPADDKQEPPADSCPTLLAGILHTKQGSGNKLARRQLSQESLNSSGSAAGRYPLGLGLGGELSSGPSSRQASGKSSLSSSNDTGLGGGDQRGRLANRLSFTPQTRRSTSAPSRPHSMQVFSRRSWLARLFDGSSSDRRGAGDADSDLDDIIAEYDMADDGLGAGKARRRRVMTQSTGEISRFLGKLKLEDVPLRSALGGNVASGMLEDVMDVSGEDEEQASRPSLSVVEIRQQTLDALNGTSRNAKQLQRLGFDDNEDVRPARVSSLPHGRSVNSASGLALCVAENDAEAGQGANRWKQRDSTLPTIRHLDTAAPSASQTTGSSASALGLGVSMSARKSSLAALPDSLHNTNSPLVDTRSAPTADSANGFTNGSTGQVRGGRSSSFTHRSTTDQQHRTASPHVELDPSNKKWAPAFWAPAPLAFHPTSAASPVKNNWSPGESAESFDNMSSISSRLSGDARYMSPRGSISVVPRGSSSPWEIVKAPADSRMFPLSPSHSRPGTPPSHSLGFFDDTSVPDSDELSIASRRSLSLHLAHSNFRQAEPLPESDDTADAALPGTTMAVLPVDNAACADKPQDSVVLGNGSLPRNADLERVFADSVQPKRRSLMWQFNAKTTLAGKALSGQNLQHNDRQPIHKSPFESTADCTEASFYDDSGHGFNQDVGNGKHDSGQPRSTPNTKRSKKWWSSVIN
ncbi:hypothetical protein LPJ66_007477 [Kickxella alabastrina]|uniref:Uncharacterized protein n=1 Tax=Kickxella alabastrina TaxID=61397 RepID=A0ACC1I9E5_9FUNG|nr:hypothetical protein LPJ66_007477 [Kickxella alabastrina]